MIMKNLIIVLLVFVSISLNAQIIETNVMITHLDGVTKGMAQENIFEIKKDSMIFGEVSFDVVDTLYNETFGSTQAIGLKLLDKDSTVYKVELTKENKEYIGVSFFKNENTFTGYVIALKPELFPNGDLAEINID